MYLPNSTFHDAFKDPTTYPQDLYIGWSKDYFSAIDGDIEASGAEFDEYFCTSEDLTYGECPASTFRVSLINKDDLRSVQWDEWWQVKLGYRSSRVEDPLPDGVNARFRWSDADPDYSGYATEYFYAKPDGLYYGSTLIDGSGECYSFYATQSAEVLYAFGNGYTYKIDMDDPTIREKVIMSRHMIKKFSTPQSIYFDLDHNYGWQYTYRSKDGYTEVWNYIPMGMYYFAKPKNLSDAVVEIECAYDFMRNFDNESTQLLEYMANNFPSGATIEEWNAYVCTFANVTAPDLPSGGATYTIDTATAKTLREIFADIAETQKGVFRFDRYGNATLYQLGTQAVEEIEPRRIEESSLSVAELKTSPPDAVVNKNTAGLTYINGKANPDNPYYILGNPFIQGNGIVSVADVQFPSYHPMSLVVLEADPCVDVGDLIDVQISPEQYKVLTDLYDRPFDDGDHSIYTIANQPLRMPLMHRLLHWNGVCTATYECTGNEKRLEPYGAELTDYNANVANDSTNIINKIEAIGISADWIKTGTMDVSRDDKDDPLITVTAPVDDEEEYGVVKTEVAPSGVSSTDSRYSDEEMTDLSAKTYANVFGALDPEISVGFQRYGNNPYRSEILLDGSYSNPHIANEINGVERFTVDPDALTFRDGNGDTTATYPSTGLHKLTPQDKTLTDTTSMTGAVINVPFLTNTDLGIGSLTNVSATCHAWLKWVCAHYTNKTNCIFTGTIQVSSVRMLRAYIYNTSTVDSNGVPQYASGTHLMYDGTMHIFGENNYVAYAKTVTAT